MANKAKYYVVWKGRKTGIFTSWEACQAQVSGFPEAKYKAFASRESAQRALAEGYQKYAGKPASTGEWLFAPHPPIAKSLSVDAACSGSPGRMEYRGAETDTGRQIFRGGPYGNGTNNIGEFLAIVHALRWLKQKKMEMPIYSDSATAIGWIRKKHCNTRLSADLANERLFREICSAENWLKENDIRTRILKWDTRAWGEIPADFNRK